jgi:hypothetical protein
MAVISANDRMVPPGMEALAAKRMGAVTTTLPTCHMVILEEPAKVAPVIDQAAKEALAKPNPRVGDWGLECLRVAERN